MKFEWDENKRLLNIKKHGLDFIDAHYIFEDVFAITYPDDRTDYGEERFIIIGSFRAMTVAAACYSERKERIRIISLRNATGKERRLYYGDS